MALGTISLVGAERAGQTLEPVFRIHLQFLGDTSYPTGGSTGFTALVAAAVGKGVADITVLKVEKVGLCGGYEPIFDLANDTLLMTRTAAINLPAEEVPNTTAMDGVTFDLLVTYK